ncbi:MAG: LysR family transcriptional regulator [Eubacteriales bacterium]|nr:LysR family transcriptional regulator [Eubacteriales bacterium]
MDIKHLEWFITISETGSFSKAAEMLHFSSTALSKQMSALEAEIGEQLLLRSNKGVALTPAGEHFLDSANNINTLIHDAVVSLKNLNDNQAKELVIGVIGSEVHHIIPAAHAHFAKKYPNIIVRYQQTSHLSLQADVSKGELDLAFTFGKSTVDLPGLKMDVGLVDVPVCVIPTTHRLAALKCIGLKDLRGEEIYTSQRCTSSYHDQLREYIEEKEPSIALIEVEENMAPVQALLHIKPKIYICPRVSAPDNNNYIVRPFGFRPSITIGIITRMDRSHVVDEYVHSAQTALSEISRRLSCDENQ